MNRRRLSLMVVAVAGAVAAVLLLAAAPASAHPLGNFSVNEYLGLTVSPDHVRARAIVDIAEIPTLQDRPAVDTNADGVPSDAERAAHAAATCARLAADVVARAGAMPLPWTVASSDFGYAPGAAGLAVSRLSCGLTAAVTVEDDSTLDVDNHYLADRVGWREMTAVGEDVRLVDSPLPARSVSAELTNYPRDLLSSALNVRSATLRVRLGSARAAAADVGAGGDRLAALTAGGDPVSRWMATVDRRFQDLAGGPVVTPLVGLLAVGLALLLGAGHAALPGHGKTVLAAYLAGRRGRPRDALAVAGTVTFTHTGTVLALGLLLTAGSRLAGERILSWLGLVSGTVILAVGATMLLRVARTHIARRRAGRESPRGSHTADPDHSHETGHSHPHSGSYGHSHMDGLGHSHAHGGHAHSHDGGHAHSHRRSPVSGRWGLAGIGVAGGLVPSPSALVVLLAAIGLGRTGFGIVLVVAYGAGMAATLTGAGLLLLAIQRRLSHRASSRVSGEASSPGRPAGPPPALVRLAGRLPGLTPVATAVLIFVVGAGLALRAAAAVV